MIHENIRAARNHHGLAARALAVTVASEPHTTTTVPAKKTVEKETKTPPAVTLKPVVPLKPVVATTSSTAIVTTTSVLEPVVPTTSSTIPVISTTSVDPTTTTSLVASVPPSSSAMTSSSASASVRYVTVTAPESSHAASSAKASASSTPVATGAVSGGAVAGGVLGGLAGLGLLAVLVFVVVRRYRKKSLDALVFNASNFRRSAILLSDPPEKEKMPEQRGPRPPSMIARHLNAPAVPRASAASPYSEHAGHSVDPYGHYTATAAQYNIGMYGADGQVTRDPYADIYGGNPGSGQHAPYGQPAFGAPPTQFQFPQRPYNQQGLYQSSFTPGAHAPAPSVNAPLPNPFSNTTPSTSASATLAAARSAAHVNSASRGSSRSNSDASSNHEVLHRRLPTQAGGAPPAYEEDSKYANIQRDVKVAPGTLAVANGDNGTSASSTSANTSTLSAQRPTSSYTVYDPEDAYGGL